LVAEVDHDAAARQYPIGNIVRRGADVTRGISLHNPDKILRLALRIQDALIGAIGVCSARARHIGSVDGVDPDLYPRNTGFARILNTVAIEITEHHTTDGHGSVNRKQVCRLH
jgi:hypothetical protein